jgi:GTPase SAR1 family protein
MSEYNPKIKVSFNIPKSILDFLDNQANFEKPELNRTQMLIKIILHYKEEVSDGIWKSTSEIKKLQRSQDILHKVERCPAFKISLIGNDVLNKNLLIHQFPVHNSSNDKLTIGVDFHYTNVKEVDVDGVLFNFKGQIWVISTDQEKYKFLRPTYYRGSKGAIIAFDLKSEEHFKKLPPLLDVFKTSIESKNIPILLVGYRREAIDKQAVSLKEINEFTSKYNLYYMEQAKIIIEDEIDCFDVLISLMAGSKIYIDDRLVFKPGKIPVTSGAGLFNSEEDIVDQAISHLKKIPDISEVVHFPSEENAARQAISLLANKFNRLHLLEIAEECKIEENLIETTLKKMIESKEIDARYFESTKSVVFR